MSFSSTGSDSARQDKEKEEGIPELASGLVGENPSQAQSSKQASVWPVPAEGQRKERNTPPLSKFPS